MKYMDDYFFDALDLLERCDLHGGWPYGGGWAEQPVPVETVVTLLRREERRWERIERKKRREQGNVGT